MSGIITFGVEWETNLSVVNDTDALFSEKVPYFLGNGNENRKNQYSLEGYHPSINDKRAPKPEVYKYCMYILEFIFGVFNDVGEFSAAMKEFIRVIEQNLCTAEPPKLQITDSQNQVRQHPIVSILDFVKHKPEGLHNVYTDCSLTNHKHVGGEEPPNNVGVYFANHCPIDGNPQLTIGVTLESTGRIFSNFINQPLDVSDTKFGNEQNQRDSSFKMASHFLFRVMGATDDLEVNIVCLEMIYVIVNRYKEIACGPGIIEYFKMLLPIKPRTNITCLISQLSVPQQQIFDGWYKINQSFLGTYFPKVYGYRFAQDYPAYNISKKFIYSAEILSGIDGVSNIAIVDGNIEYIGYTQNDTQYTIKNTMNMIPGEFLVWYGRIPQLEAVLLRDGNIVFPKRRQSGFHVS